MSVQKITGFAFAILAFVFTAQVLAQSPAPLPNPNLHLFSSGSVSAVARLPDGSVVFGGAFTSVNGTPRSNIAKLQSNGTLDPNWNPSANGNVYSLAVDSDDNVYVAGDFSTIGGQSRFFLAKLSGSGAGAADANWDPSPDGAVYALAVDGIGNVYAGGYFTMIGGQSRRRIAKLSSGGAGAADVTWNPSANSYVWSLALDGIGNVYAGGNFATIGGQSRNCIAKLSGTGSGAADVNWNPSANGSVQSLAVDGNGNVYAGGYYSMVGGQSRRSIAKLSGSGSGAADANWNPSANSLYSLGSVYSLVVDGNGNVYAGGDFTTIGGQNRNYIAKLSGTGAGAADANWDPSANGSVRSLVFDGSGNVYAGGGFTTIGGQLRLGFAMLSSAGIVGTAADAEETNTRVNALAVQPDGGVIVGGSFLKANGLPRGSILRLQTDGTLDPAWNPSANGYVDSLVVDGSGNVYTGGRFTMIGGQSRNYIAKLSGNGTGAADANWNPSANGEVDSLAVDGSGNLYAGGSFTAIGGQSRNYIAKLSSSGTGAADANWNPSANNIVFALALDGNSNVYSGGYFTTIGGQSRQYIAKLSGSGTGAADANWNPSAYYFVHALAVDGSGNVYAGGSPQTGGSLSYGYLAKFSGSGTIANWNPLPFGFATGAGVEALAVDGSGNVYVGGYFDLIGDQYRSNFAKLSSCGAGAADANWDPSADNYVQAIALDIRGNVYVGGNFTSIGGQGRVNVAALSGRGDDIFCSGFE